MSHYGQLTGENKNGTTVHLQRPRLHEPGIRDVPRYFAGTCGATLGANLWEGEGAHAAHCWPSDLTDLRVLVPSQVVVRIERERDVYACMNIYLTNVH